MQKLIDLVTLGLYTEFVKFCINLIDVYVCELLRKQVLKILHAPPCIIYIKYVWTELLAKKEVTDLMFNKVKKIN